MKYFHKTFNTGTRDMTFLLINIHLELNFEQNLANFGWLVDIWIFEKLTFWILIKHL